MNEFIGMAEQSLRSFFKDKVNTLIVINIIGFLITIILFSISFKNQIKIKRKIDHRYFNTTRSLEDIFDVEIDTYKGRVVNPYTQKSQNGCFVEK